MLFTCLYDINFFIKIRDVFVVPNIKNEIEESYLFHLLEQNGMLVFIIRLFMLIMFA